MGSADYSNKNSLFFVKFVLIINLKKNIKFIKSIKFNIFFFLASVLENSGKFTKNPTVISEKLNCVVFALISVWFTHS